MSESLVIPLARAKKEGLARYFTGKPCKNGHIAHRFTASRECQECVGIRQRSKTRKDYMAAYKRERRAANPEIREAERLRSLERMRAIYAPIYNADPARKERANAMRRERYALLKSENPEKLRRKFRSDYRRMTSIPQGRLKNRLRARFHSVLRGKHKPGYCLDLVGCSLDALIQHIEQQFSEGMSWSTFGKWHIDHIRPCSSFDLEDPAQVRQCFHYTNLQPLWAVDNLRKGATFANA